MGWIFFEVVCSWRKIRTSIYYLSMTSDVEYQFKVSKIGMIFTLFKFGLFFQNTYKTCPNVFSSKSCWNTTSEIIATNVFCDQSHYIEVISIEQKMIFGLVLGRLAILKKTFGADYEQLWRAVFSSFQEQKIFFIFFENTQASALKSCIKSL